MLNGDNPSNAQAAPPINAVQFTVDSFKYGFQSFHKLGPAWWILTVFYCFFEFYTDRMITGLPESGINSFTTQISVLFIFSFLELPYLNIGLKYYSSGKCDHKNTEDAFSQIWPYFWACFIFTAFFAPLYVTYLSEGMTESSALYLLFALIILFWIFYCLYRMFPYLYIVLDKKIGPVEALKRSLEITHRKFTTVFTFIVGVIFVYILFDQVPYSLGYLVSGPVVALAGIHAYKQLDAYHQQLKNMPQESGQVDPRKFRD